MLDVKEIRKDFPLFEQSLNGKSVIYLDSGAATLKPASVLAAVCDYYSRYPVNVHRGDYKLALQATSAYEKSREKLAEFVGASEPQEIIFTRNCTEAINLVARALPGITARKKILVTVMDHHSNLLPWRGLLPLGFELDYLGVKEDFSLNPEELSEKLTSQVALFAFPWASNTVGSINPVKQLVEKAQSQGILTLIDAAQGAPHFKLDLKALGVDFAAFSGHKMLGPSGVGVLYGKKALLAELSPLLLGGGMVTNVGVNEFSMQEVPHRFEAGTPNIEAVLGLKAAVEYLEKIGFSALRDHIEKLFELFYREAARIPGLSLFAAPPTANIGMALFELKGFKASQLSFVLDQLDNICVRAGMHCSQMLVEKLNPQGICRASFYLYNSTEEVEILLTNLQELSQDLVEA